MGTKAVAAQKRGRRWRTGHSCSQRTKRINGCRLPKGETWTSTILQKRTEVVPLKSLPLVTGLATLLTFAVVATACGGDGPLTLEEYFDRVGEISESRTSQLDDIEGRLNDLGEGDLKELKDIFADLGEASREAVEDVEALTPPEEASTAHGAFVAQGLAMMDEFDRLVEALQEVEDPEDALIAFTGSPDLDAAEGEFEGACRGLQKVATNAGIDVDLGCGESD